MTNILVTGGAGYIGSMLIPVLLLNNFRVHCIDNFRYRQYLSLASCYSNPNFSIQDADVTVYPWKNVLSGFDIIIPLAAYVGAPLCDKHKYRASEVNTGQITSLLEHVKNQLIIFPNTNSGYGVTGADYAVEDTPLNPISCYGKSKCLAEYYIRGYKNSIVLRLATVYGMSPRMRLDLLVNDFVWRAVKDKCITLFESNHRRSVVHIWDVVRAFLFAVWNSDQMKGKTYNVVGNNITKKGLCERIRDTVASDLCIIEAPYGEDPDKRDYFVSSQKLLDAEFAYTKSLESGIKELALAYSIMPSKIYGNV